MLYSRFIPQSPEAFIGDGGNKPELQSIFSLLIAYGVPTRKPMPAFIAPSSLGTVTKSYPIHPSIGIYLGPIQNLPMPRRIIERYLNMLKNMRIQSARRMIPSKSPLNHLTSPTSANHGPILPSGTYVGVVSKGPLEWEHPVSLVHH